MAFAVCDLLFCAVFPLMCSLGQQMVRFFVLGSKCCGKPDSRNRWRICGHFSDIHSALRHKESRIQAPERGSTPAQQFE